MKKSSHVAAFVLAFVASFPVHAGNLKNGTVISQGLGRQVMISSIDGISIVSQDKDGATSFERLRLELDAEVEGNICTATAVISQLTRESSNDDWKNHITEKSLKLGLVTIVPSYSETDGCAEYSRRARIKIQLASLVGPPETSAFQKYVFHVAIPLGYSGTDQALVRFDITSTYGEGWSIKRL